MYRFIFNIYRSATDHLENLLGVSLTSSIWFWISLLQFCLLLYLINKRYKKNRNTSDRTLNREQKKKFKRSSVNMDDLMQSINRSKELYKKLSRSCHPDRFIGKPEQKNAEFIFQEISRYKRDYKQLICLREKAEQELNIKI